jgi:cytoskeletal protein RodZ
MNEIIDKEPETIEQEKVQESKTYRVQNNNVKKTVNRVTKIAHTSVEIKSSIADPLVDRLPTTSYDNVSQLDSDTGANTQPDESSEFINKASLGPGMILKNIRLDAKLAKEDVAKELRLAVRHIDHLENDNFEKFTALAFYIGFLRNYSKLLGLDPEKMVGKFYAVYKVMPEKVHYKHIAVNTWQDSWPMKLFLNKEPKQFEKVKNIKLFIFGSIIAVIFVCLWWALSTIGINHLTTSSNIENLPPEVVDNLLPSQPVIVLNSTDVEVKPASDTAVLPQSLIPSDTALVEQLVKAPNVLVSANNQEDNLTVDKISKHNKLDDIS